MSLATCGSRNYKITNKGYVTGRGGQRQEREGFKDLPKQFI